MIDWPTLTFPPINLWSAPVQLIDTMIGDIMKKEGGYVNHPNDRGGPTNYGITRSTLGICLGRPCTTKDVKALSKSDAETIYKKLYYSNIGIDKLPEDIQPIIFDMGINCGPARAVKLLQTELLADGYNVGVIDGRIGAKTINAAERAYAEAGSILINNLVERRIEYYRAIVKADNTQHVFLNGWLARAESFRALA